MYIHKAVHPLLKASWEGDKRLLEGWQISNPPGLITKMYSSHWTPIVHWKYTSPKKSETVKIPTSPQQAEFQTKGGQNQELLTWLWQISDRGSLKGHFSRTNLSRDAKGQTAPRFLPLLILQDNPTPIQQQTSKWGSTSTSSSKTISNQFCREQACARESFIIPIENVTSSHWENKAVWITRRNCPPMKKSIRLRQRSDNIVWVRP